MMVNQAKHRGRRAFGEKPAEAAVVAAIKLKARKRKGGGRPALSLIARELNAEGCRTQSGRPFAAQTIKNILARKELGQNDGQRNRRKKTMLGVNDYLNIDQIWKVRGVLRAGCERVLFETMLGTGLRASEVCGLQIRDLAIYDGRAEIEVRRGKGAKQRTVTIGQGLAGELRGYCEKYRRGCGRLSPVFFNSQWGALGYDGLYQRIKGIGRRAGIVWLHPHVMRHTFATILSNNGKNAFFIQHQLGHSSLDTTAIYAKVSEKLKLEQMELFEESIKNQNQNQNKQ